MVVFFILPNSVQCKRRLELISYQKTWSDNQNVCKSPYFLRIYFNIVLHVTQCFSCLVGFFLIVVQDVAYTYLIRRAWNSFLQNYFFFNRNWRLFSICGRLSWRRPASKCSKKNVAGLDSWLSWFDLLHCGCFQMRNSFDEGPSFCPTHWALCMWKCSISPCAPQVTLLQLGVNSWCCRQVLEVLLCFMSSLSPLLYVLLQGKQWEVKP